MIIKTRKGEILNVQNFIPVNDHAKNVVTRWVLSKNEDGDMEKRIIPFDDIQEIYETKPYLYYGS